MGGTNFEKGAHYAREGHGRTPSSAHVMAPGGHPRRGDKGKRQSGRSSFIATPAWGGVSHRFGLPGRQIGGTEGVTRPARRLCSPRPRDSNPGIAQGMGGGTRTVQLVGRPLCLRASQICAGHRPGVLRHKRRQPPPPIPARRTNRRTCCDAARTQGAVQVIKPSDQPRLSGRGGDWGDWKPNNCGGRTGRLLEGGGGSSDPSPPVGGVGGEAATSSGGPPEGCQGLPPLWGRRNVG